MQSLKRKNKAKSYAGKYINARAINAKITPNVNIKAY
jgi:hypothetical protein